MQTFEFKVIPAPRRAERSKGAKGTADRFARTLTEVMNELGRDGWDYVRADLLPCEERSGFFRRSVVERHMLVFRRVIPGARVAADPVAKMAADAAASLAPAQGPQRGFRQDAGRPDLARPVMPHRPDLRRSDPGRADLGRADLGRADPGRADLGRGDTALPAEPTLSGNPRIALVASSEASAPPLGAAPGNGVAKP